MLSAELRKPDDSFDGINIVSKDDELGFLFFNELGDFVKTELDGDGSLNGGFSLYSISFMHISGTFKLGLSSFSQSFSSLFRSFNGVSLEELHEGGGCKLKEKNGIKP